MFEALDSLNERLAGELETPLAIGIGVHTVRRSSAEWGRLRRRSFRR
jgi:hypothetical protein